MKIPYNLQFRIDLQVWNKLLYCNPGTFDFIRILPHWNREG